jgi:hypothetical protein
MPSSMTMTSTAALMPTNRRLDGRHMAIKRIGDAEGDDDEGSGQREEETRGECAKVPLNRQPI